MNHNYLPQLFCFRREPLPRGASVHFGNCVGSLFSDVSGAWSTFLEM